MTLREKIVRQPVKTHRYDGKRYLTLDGVDEILTLISEKIERVDITDPDPHNYEGEWEALIAGKEAGRQAILSVLGR